MSGGIIGGLPPHGSIVDGVRSQAVRTPAAPAVEYHGSTVTYAELWQQSAAVAAGLRRSGVSRGAIVAISMERSLALPVAILGVLMAGAAYVPLDTAYPAERVRFMLENSGATLVLCDAGTEARWTTEGVSVLAARALIDDTTAPDDEAWDGGGADDLVYVIYTSGSTGTPKGVAMHGAPLLNLLAWQLSDSAGGRTLQFAPISFDVHFQDFFATWWAGGTLIMIDDDERRDAIRLLARLHQDRVARVFLPFIALQALCDAATMGEVPTTLREVITAGEQLQVTPQVQQFFERLPSCSLVNQYGPSETHVITAYTLIGPPADWPRLPPIGRAIPGTAVAIVDEHLVPVAAGHEGELLLGGLGVARGYLGRDDLTRERFIAYPDIAGGRAYRSGDLVRELPSGELQFLGRRDGQVKVRGYRIELGEIEVALMADPRVTRAAVVVLEDVPGDRRVVGYVATRADAASMPVDLRERLIASLPDYMVPSAIVVLEAIPLTPSGKVDRLRLPAPSRQRPALATIYAAPRTPLQASLVHLWGALLQLDEIGIDDNFFELGGNSLLALRAVAQMRRDLGLELAVVALFSQPTIAGIAALGERTTANAPGWAARLRGAADGEAPAIAIIGMAGRFPGADSIDAFWQNLTGGVESITRFATLDPSIPARLATDPRYVAARGILPDPAGFDAAFFGIPPLEARVIDPQQRLLLEVMWEAMESAGYLPGDQAPVTGVFAGTHNNSYARLHVDANPDAVERLGAFNAMVANEKDYVATRVAHRLGLTGPALSIHTACSTSLVAVVEAFHSLRRGDCDLALAGGASITLPQASGHLYDEGGMLSADGHCRPFDAKATGTMFSDGIGVVALKRLPDAVRDGDTIHAVIRGAAINNDGARKASFAAPSVDGQAAVIASALAVAGVNARSVSYVEAHGTATPLGDPIEVAALTQAFGLHTADRQFCALGSVKSNLGHLTAASGVAGLIKTALAVREATLPPTLHFTAANPAIDFAATPFHVVHERTEWTASPRRAGVSSFGVGGTNAHVVLEEAPVSAPSGPARARHLLTWSARTPASLEALTQRLANFLVAYPQANLADLSFVQHVGRREWPLRRAIVVTDVADAATALATSARTVSDTAASPPPLAFVFPGQGSQHVGMGAALYTDEPEFRVAIDQCAEWALPVLGTDLRAVLYPAAGASTEAAELLKQTAYAQTALFAVEYALTRLLMTWGLEPAALIGHSVGEWVAAAVAGVMAPADAMRLVALRGQLMQAQPAGAMLSVRAPAAEVQAMLPPTVSLASDNAPRLCVVSGPVADIASLERTLMDAGLVTRRLETSHAFHSAMMDPVVEPMRQALEGITLHAPTIQIVSSCTGQRLSDADATDPGYWARHLREPVRFRDAVSTLADKRHNFIGVGPRTAVATLLRQNISDRASLCLPTLGDVATPEGEWDSLLETVGRLWASGSTVEWVRFHEHERRRRIPAPTYAFDHVSHWLEPAQPAHSPALLTSADAPLMPTSAPVAPKRIARLLPVVRRSIEDFSGLTLGEADDAASFVQLGLDSLALTQVATEVQKQVGVKLTFRMLMEEHTSIAALATYLDGKLPPDPVTPAAPAPSVAPAVSASSAPTHLATIQPLAIPLAPPPGASGSGAPSMVREVIDQQLRVMAMQLQLLGGQSAALPAELPVAPTGDAAPAAPVLAPEATAPATAVAPSTDVEAHTTYDVKKAFGAMARISTSSPDVLTPLQRASLDSLMRRYTARTAQSKARTEQYRSVLADPRVVTGFRPLIKEMIYPLVVDRSKGARLWDIDGNEYVDALNGFGSNFFGHSPDFILDAVRAQLEKGYELGPMHPLAQEVAALMCEITGFDRAGLCNTGSEAVMGCMRIARTVTGRSLIAIFSGSYHGIFDEVIVRGTKRLRSVPASPGIMQESVENVLVLDYGTDETLEILRARAHELAAVMVEPIQSRRPDFQPGEFLRQVRAITEQHGCAFIFDEVITGFRMHQRGAQEIFGVRADLASYGKIVGGGQPIGVVAGKREWMDALDGGHWQFGDASTPTVGVTYFAGTFVRHPLALAAAKAVLTEMKERGPALQDDLNARCAAMAADANSFLHDAGVPMKMKYAGSLWKLVYTEDQAHGDLLFAHMRDRGIHIWDGFPCFLTTAFTDADIQTILAALRSSVVEMQQAGFLPGSVPARLAAPTMDANLPPVPGARLGRDPEGNPAWYAPHPTEAGSFVMVGQ